MTATAPTAEELLNVWRRVVDTGYREAIESDEEGSFALFRATAEAWAHLAQRIQRSAQSCFYLRHGAQEDEPASSTVRATFTAKLERTLDLHIPVILAPGAMRIESLGRTYVNRDEVTWLPFDDVTEKDVVFEAEVPGFAGNIEFAKDADVETNIRLDRIAFADQDKGRTNIDGRVRTEGSFQDTGAPDVFEPTDIGLYVRLLTARDSVGAPTSDLGRTLRITGYNDPRVESPVGSGLLPTVVNFETEELFRVAGAKADDGSVFTDELAEAHDDTADDMTLLPAAPVVGDAYYVGATTGLPTGARFDVSTPGAGVWTITWRYYNGSGFADLPNVTDETGDFRLSGPRDVTWEVPSDAAPTTIDGQVAYWARAELTAFTSLTTQPLGRRAVLIDRLD
ncbi:unnamed protein product, partial [marine sediment metagenome]